jgi:hypothetical protein
LRESDWPDWQKAVVLASAFLISIECIAYRFDDYHITTDTFIFFSVVLSLWLAKTDVSQRQLGLAAGLGVLSGLAMTTRLNDGSALLVSVGICLLALTRKRKLFVTALFVLVTAATLIFVVKLTGDSFSDYFSNSIIRAAGAKGGTGTILTAPFRFFLNAREMFHGRRWIFLWIVAMVAVGALAQRYWKIGARSIVPLQLGIAGTAFVISSAYRQHELRTGAFVAFLSVFLIVVNYLLLPFIAVRFLWWRVSDQAHSWDRRELLFLIPLGELASASTSTAAHTASVFLSPIALLLLLIPVLRPFRRQDSWMNASLMTVMILIGISTIITKIHDPYSWLNFRSSPMFVNRQWYRHPVYGPMYVDRDLLHFVEPVCREIEQGNSRSELLSMPFSYPNYFCNTPPWHGYVQTFFDTTTRATIHNLMSELNAAPPEWIIYEREVKILTGQERAYSPGQPLAHRELDAMIMQKIQSKEWQVVDKSNYLFSDKKDYFEGDGWLVIRTRPSGSPESSHFGQR